MNYKLNFKLLPLILNSTGTWIPPNCWVKPHSKAKFFLHLHLLLNIFLSLKILWNVKHTKGQTVAVADDILKTFSNALTGSCAPILPARPPCPPEYRERCLFLQQLDMPCFVDARGRPAPFWENTEQEWFVGRQEWGSGRGGRRESCNQDIN